MTVADDITNIFADAFDSVVRPAQPRPRERTNVHPSALGRLARNRRKALLNRFEIAPRLAAV